MYKQFYLLKTIKTDFLALYFIGWAEPNDYGVLKNDFPVFRHRRYTKNVIKRHQQVFLILVLDYIWSRYM